MSPKYMLKVRQKEATKLITNLPKTANAISQVFLHCTFDRLQMLSRGNHQIAEFMKSDHAKNILM